MKIEIQTDYPIGYWFTVRYGEKIVKDTRKDENGLMEYLLNDGRWVTGCYITAHSD